MALTFQPASGIVAAKRFKAVPAPITVDQINADRLFDIAAKFWSSSTAGKHADFDAQLIGYIYSHEMLRNRFTSRRMSMLELSQYLDLYLWPNYKGADQQQMQVHVLSIVALVNEKFRQRADAWRSIRDSPKEFPVLFDTVMRFVMLYFDETNSSLSSLETSQLLQFLTNCFISLEEDIVRECVQKLFGLPMWSCLTPHRRQIELQKRPKLAKIWAKFEKSEAKKTQHEREKQQTYSRFMFTLMEKMIGMLKSLPPANADGEEDDAMADGDHALTVAVDVQDAKNTTGNVRVLEKFFDLVVECLSSLHTRRFFVFLLDEYHFTMRCRMAPFLTEGADESSKVLTQLLQQIDIYMQFELSLTGADLPRKEIVVEHYEKVQALQKAAFRLFPDKLRGLFLAPVKDLVADDGGVAFKKLMGSLNFEQLKQLAVATGIIPKNNVNENDESENSSALSWLDNQETLLAVFATYYVLKASPLEQLNAEPLYPTETILWNKSLVPDDQHDLSELSLVLPKLNLQFLSLHDYLMRNYYLFRLESAYEIRQDIEDVVLRMKPWQSEHDGRTLFGGWARMAQPLVEFRIVEIADARAGERAPEWVRGEFAVTLDVRDDVRAEWERLRVHDVCFLLCVQAHAPRGTRFDPDGNVPEQTGLRFVRGCEIEGLLDESGKLIDEVDRIAAAHATGKLPMQYSTLTRRYRVMLDPNQYYQDICAVRAATDRNDAEGAVNPYQVMNIVMRRRSEANNFKAVLETLRVLMNSGHTVVPDWLKDVLLGYGDPGSASWQMLSNQQNVLSFNDTFLDYSHVRECFPHHDVQLLRKTTDPADSDFDKTDPNPPFRLHFDFKANNAVADALSASKSVIKVESYQPPQLSPYPQHIPKRNQVRFTAAQTRAILSGMQPGLTVIVGPPGTGKTDVAVQIIANLYHNFPAQRTIIVTHSNQALNQIFEKLMQLDIDERHLLRLGHGEEALETSKDFSRYGRVDYVLSKRMELLREVERLQASLQISGAAALSHTCETSNYFFLYQIRPRWRRFVASVEKARTGKNVNFSFDREFPFRSFFADAPQPLFRSDAEDDAKNFDADWEKAQLCWRYIQHVFDQLEEFRAFELLRGGPERSRYLLIKEAKIIAMTCTHAAIRRQDLVSFGFTYDNIVMEEAAQILEVETFVPLLLQRPEHGQHNRLKRWIMLGDHNQLPPIIQNKAFEKYSNMEQSLFARFIRLGVPHVLLDAQGRARPSLRELFSWRYGVGKLGDLPHVLGNTADSEYAKPNAGFRFDFQLIDVPDFNGVGESAPSRHFIQNLAEAEYMVATFMYMRLLGYPAERITMLAAYQGQRQLLQDIVDRRCGENGNPLFGEPARISTVDKYQGQQNDYVLLSMVRTSQVGYLRDVRRIIVALSRARLGLYVFARARLFLNCYETAPAFQIMARNNRPLALHLMPDESWPLSGPRTVENADENEKTSPPAGVVVIPDMPAMCNFVRELYERRVREDPERMTTMFAEHEQRKRNMQANTTMRGDGNAQQANKTAGHDPAADLVPFYELPHDVRRRKRELQKSLQEQSQSVVKVEDDEASKKIDTENVEKKADPASAKPTELAIQNEITDDIEEDEEAAPAAVGAQISKTDPENSTDADKAPDS